MLIKYSGTLKHWSCNLLGWFVQTLSTSEYQDIYPCVDSHAGNNDNDNE